MKLPFPLQETEQVLALTRRHWLFLYPRLAALVLLMVVPVIALWTGLSVADALDGIARNAGLVASAIWVLYWGVRTYLLKYRYDNDIWVVTSQRVVDSVRSNPLSLHMTSADLVDIVDTSIDRSGLFRTLFDFGDIQCETAGDRHDLALSAIPRPREIHALIDRERDRERKGTMASPAGPSPQAAEET